MAGCLFALTSLPRRFCSQAMESDVREVAAAWGPGCGRSLHRGKRSEQPGSGAAVPLREGSQHHVQQVLVEGLERDLRLFREISAQAGLSTSASGLCLVLEFEAKIRAAKGDVQHEARDHLAGGESQLDAYAWPFLRKEQQEKQAASAERPPQRALSGRGRR